MTGSRRRVRYARKRLDLARRDLAYGLAACLRPPSERTAAARLAVVWRPPETVLACLSARSGFDLLLGSVDWPPGSEVLLSAITIPHMAALVRHHGFVPVAVDLDPATTELDLAAVRRAATPRTRALVFAHLFGIRVDLRELVAIAHQNGWLLVEDRAQAYDGVDRELGTADVALHSFGTIKSATCLGGAVVLVRDAALRTRMRDRQQAYPRQPALAYAGRLGKGTAMLALGHPRVYPHFTRILDLLLGDYDEVVRSLSRGFEDETLLARIRRRPSAPLVALMGRRMRTYEPARVADRRAAGDYLASRLDRTVEHLGGAGRGATHWLFPVVSSAPSALVAAGRAAGFDLTRGSSTLVALEKGCVQASRAMRDVVYLPVDRRTPRPALDALAAVVNRIEATGQAPRAAPSSRRGGTRRSASTPVAKE